MAGAGRPKCTSAEAGRPGRGGAKRRDTEACLAAVTRPGRDARGVTGGRPGGTRPARPSRSVRLDRAFRRSRPRVPFRALRACRLRARPNRARARGASGARSRSCCDKGLELSLGPLRRPRLALPDHANLPAGPAQRRGLPAIPSGVLVALRIPEGGVCRGNDRPVAAAVQMPEASVNEEGHAELREDEIGTAGQVLAMKPEPQPEAMSDASDDELRLRVLSTYRLHVSAALLGRQDVDHPPRVRPRVPPERRQ